MTIRTATPADAESLARVSAITMREAFGPPFNPMAWVDAYIEASLTVPQLEQELADPRSTFFVAEGAEGELIGFAKVRKQRPPRRMPERNALEIQRIYLLQAHTGGGRGRQLMEHCLQFARAQGYKAVFLGVWERNERAQQFYSHLGFKPFGWHYFQFGPDRQRDIWMQKPL
ncbi:GNAT family N-acetyltransferase [Rudanella lutea]|uniref:GNAT family N-acetyltransferase n=1 Tax=Rudanella lutea TaxID=451374 RepID=UPI000370E420|nr:GNAT family N-acetyltransferase [Rudanella lutea]